MALKHNKKKNSRIVYEQLMMLSTRLALSGHAKEANMVINLIKERYSSNTLLGREKKIFDSIIDSYNLNEDSAKSIIQEALSESVLINEERLEREKVALINCIIREVGKDLFSIPVKDFKLMASTQILLNESRNQFKYSSPKERAKIKDTLLEHMKREIPKEESYEMDNFTFSILKRKFDEKYSSILNEDQRDILSGWFGFLMSGDKLGFQSLLESKVDKARKEIDYISTDPKLLKEDYSSLLGEARVELKDDLVKEVNEENVLQIMKYFDLVEDLREIRNEQMEIQ